MDKRKIIWISCLVIICILLIVLVYINVFKKKVDVNSSTEETENTEEVKKLEENKTLVSFEEKLNEKGFKFEKLETSAIQYGAIKAYNYNFEEGTMVIAYVYDTKSDVFKKAKSSKKLVIEGTDVDFEVTASSDILFRVKYTGDKTNEITKLF